MSKNKHKHAKAIEIHPSLLPFCGTSVRTKTLMYALEPDLRTQVYLDKRGVVMSAKERKQKMREVKGIIDGVYRELVAQQLEAAPELVNRARIDAVVKAQEAYDAAADPDERYKLRGKLNAANLELKEDIEWLFRSDELVKASPKDMLEKVVPERLRDAGRYADAERLTELSMQSSYYTDYKDKRDRELSASATAGGGKVADRIVEDNLPILIRNRRIAAEALDAYPEVAAKLGMQVDDLLDELGRDMWPTYFSQKGIDGYNALIGGVVGEGGVRLMGVNQALSEAWDADKSRMRRRPKLAKLKKMIGAAAESLSVGCGEYGDDIDLAEDVAAMRDALGEVVDTETGEVLGAAGAIADAFRRLRDAGFDGVGIGSAKGIGYLSRVVYGREVALHNANETCREGKLGPYSTKRKKELGIKSTSKANMLKSGVPVSLVVEIADAAGVEGDWSKLEAEAKAQGARLDAVLPAVANALSKCTETSFLQSDGEGLAAMVEFCAAVNGTGALARMLASAEAGEDYLERYEAPDGMPLSTLLREANRMTSRVRSHLTKKAYSTDHWEVDFGNPKLGAGWDANKTFEYGNMLLKHAGRYYYGVIARGVDDEGARIKFDKRLLDGEPASMLSGEPGADWALMRYKYNPSSSKMLGKMFQGKAGAKYGMPDELAYGMEGYEGPDGKERRRYNEDPDFLRELIAAVKARISGDGVPAEWQPDGWEHFDFSYLREPDEYASWADFCADVDRGSYAAWEVAVSDATVQRAVEKGELYLFEITNAAIRRGQKGTRRTAKADLYARYLEELASPSAVEHRIRLAGGTQVFFRPASVERPAVHKAGSWLVNRTYVDADGVRRTLPERVRREIFAHLNGHEGHEVLGEEAAGYMDVAAYHRADHDIMRDARFARDAFELHVCAVVNHDGFDAANAKGRSAGQQLDSDLVEHIVTDQPPVLAVARGERCLAYAVLTDPDGDAIDEWDLSVIDGVDYRSQLMALYELRREEESRWEQRSKIKDAKNAYIERLVAVIARKIVETGAVVAIEEVDDKFKDKRGFFEPQLWKGFAIKLVTKLSCLVTDNALDCNEPGSPTNPLQLANPWTAYPKAAVATGDIIHVPAHYIADIDLVTGYVPAAARAFQCSTGAQAEAAIRALRSLCYKHGAFTAEICFKDFAKVGVSESFKTDKRVWTLTSRCSRKAVYAPGKRGPVPIDVTAALAKLLEDAGIGYADGHDLREDICSAERSAKFKRAVCELIRAWMQVRNGYGEDGCVTATPVLGGEQPESVERHKARALALKAVAMIETACPKPIKKNDPDAGQHWRIERVFSADWADWIADRA